MTCRVRSYLSADRAAVRQICADTGFMGKPIDAVFADRESFADFFTCYYTDFEPDCALVAEDAASGNVVGYLLGCVRPHYRAAAQTWLLATRFVPTVLGRLVRGHYDRRSRAFLRWVVFRALRETPPAPAQAAHFHINLLPAYRTGLASREMIFRFFALARRRGMSRVYGQIQTRDDRRTAFWTRYGFREWSRRRVTKFEAHDPATVYVTTLFRDFSEN